MASLVCYTICALLSGFNLYNMTVFVCSAKLLLDTNMSTCRFQHWYFT